MVDRRKVFWYYKRDEVHIVNSKEVISMTTTLRGLVFSKYPSISAFAEAIGWSRGKASRIANGTQQPSKEDMEELIKLLEIPQQSVAPVFFGSMFTM